MPKVTTPGSTGFSPSVTKACSTWLSIGSRRPAIAPTWLDRPATAIPTFPAAMYPREVSTPRTRPCLDAEPGHLAVLDQVHPARVRPPGEPPGHRVVPRRARPPLQEPAADREARVGEVEERPPRPHLLARQELRVVALHPHGVPAPREGVELPVRMAEVQHAALRHHHVVVQLLLQPLPELQRMRVELAVPLEQVVRPHDRGVAPDVAAAEIPPLQHRDIGDPVVLREVVGRRQPVPAAADDDDVIGGLRLRVAPDRRPAPVAGQRIPNDRPGRIPHGREQSGSARQAQGGGYRPPLSAPGAGRTDAQSRR